MAVATSLLCLRFTESDTVHIPLEHKPLMNYSTLRLKNVRVIYHVIGIIKRNCDIPLPTVMGHSLCSRDHGIACPYFFFCMIQTEGTLDQKHVS